MARREQLDLFGNTASAAADSTKLVAIPRGRAPLGKHHKAFNREAERVRTLREALAAWQDYARRYEARIDADIMPAQRALRDAQRRLVLRLDALARATARGERSSRARRRALARHIEQIVAQLLASGDGDPALEALHDAYADTPYAQLAQAELDELEGMFAQMLGDDALAGHDASSPAELFEHVRAHVEASEHAHGQHAGSSRARRVAARETAQRTEALGTVRTIWRKLASAVHPDREANPTERARKTVLMQRANDAYERNDVLTLLSLQIELEQLDPDHLASAQPQRLQHFVTVLKEQAAALEQEIEQCLLPFRMLLDRPHGPLLPEMVDASLEKELAEMREMTQVIEVDLARLDDPHQRRMLLDALVAEENARTAFDELGISDGLPSDDDFLQAIAALIAAEHGKQTTAARRMHRKTKRKGTKKKGKKRTKAAK